MIGMFDVIKVQQDTIKQLHKQFTGAAQTRASYAIDQNGDILLTPDENITYYMDNRHAPLRVFRASECIAVIMPFFSIEVIS